MKLTNNFTLDEFTRSQTADKKGIKNIPGEKEVSSIKRLAEKVLQPVRDSIGKSIHINSGFRCIELNQAVGGVATSQHVKGEAADIYATGIRARELFNAILKMGIEFDQIILYPTFVHISYSEGKNRKQILYAKGVAA